ncbi:hypothetical protein KYI92_00045 [Pantoea allii]|uniref:Uncharacterized protein n=1 Tax=Pantoea allii TaxID=574096 RepID=A0ABS6V8G0_9GAMM|nr:hypothetical protein [Pantoea allii]MBW1212753.1 hypothetical protein [Pantoea allii]MBW1255609.1 hypothetical protein [Pantoea allii]MBW1264686.1 hypothetical protein [Pantoea allii]MBW1286803.1 hypothetical protein [Pantoea allii]
MTKLNKAVAKIQKAIDELEKAILTKDKKVLSVSSINQLSKFKESFITVLSLIQSDNIPPKNERVLGIARVIADQWPFNLELGSIIIDAEQAYKDI